MLSLKGITKNYYLNKTNVVRVLKGVTIDFRENEFVSILGASGCGKTTLLNVVGGLDTYEGGDLLVDGVSTRNFSASDWDNYRNKKIGFVFQSYNLIQHINVVRNVEMPLILAGVKKSIAREKAISVLKTVGLEEQIYKKPLQLSGGQMQRVAIARALVTDPEIILADEPTGALDNEASVQVMDLLKKVADNHLVIMVTHNNLLADEYSTRIINLSGGVVSGDSNPYVCNQPIPEKQIEKTPVQEEETVKKGRKKKSSLSFTMATELSARNLISKKVRTALTSFAGSIGIIGIVLVLAFSAGVSTYISNLERSALSIYPLTISRTDTSAVTQILEKLMTSYMENEREEYPDTEEIYTKGVMSKAMTEILTLFTEKNDLVSFKKYLEEHRDEVKGLGEIKYDYGVPINVYCADPSPDVQNYMKVNPFTDLMDDYLSKMKDSSMTQKLSSLGNMASSWTELSDDEQLLRTQYELVGKNSRWPSHTLGEEVDKNGKKVKTTEVIIVVDERNQLNDYSLFMLGLRSGTSEEIFNALSDENIENKKFTVDELLNLQYYVLGASDYVDRKVDEEGNEIENWWTRTNKKEQSPEFVLSHYSVKAKVVGVVRPKKGSVAMTISGAVGYDSSLTQYLIERANEHEATKYMQEVVRTYTTGEGKEEKTHEVHRNAFHKANEFSTEEEYLEALAEMGTADFDNPTNIFIYANSFENKEKLIEFIRKYNEEVSNEKTIKYSDMLATIMSYVNTMTTAISSVLIGFMSISLVVSSIMIAVIIYTSVLERRKEVGILRSIGARKRDIVSIFMAESGILGLSSGLLGVFVGWIITLPLKAILLTKVGIPNIAIVQWWHVVMMVAISFGLSILAGVIPAFLGAKQDPAEALRTE